MDIQEGACSCPDTAGLGQLLPESWWVAVTFPPSLDVSLLGCMQSPLPQGIGGVGKVTRISRLLQLLGLQRRQKLGLGPPTEALHRSG